MIRILQVILAVLVRLLSVPAADVSAPPWYYAFGFLLSSIVLIAALSRFLGTRTVKRFSHRPSSLAKRRRRIRFAVVGLGLVAYAVLLHHYRWQSFVAEGVGLARWVLINEVFVLLPYGLIALAEVWGTYPLERKLRFAKITMESYVEREARQILLPFLPYLAVRTFFDLLALSPRASEVIDIYPVFQVIASAACLSVIFLLAPLGVKAFFPSRALERSAMRDRLEEVLRRTGVRCRDILVWDTGGVPLMTACIAGVWAPFRYVFFTEILLWQLSPREVEAIFCHEVGHARRRHMLIYFFFALFFILLLGLLPPAEWWPWVPFGRPALALWASLEIGIFFVFLLFYWFVLFGILSRRLEAEADLFGAEELGDFDHFMEALRRVSFMGGRRRRWAFRHYSIEKRLELLERWAGSPESRQKFRRGVRRLLLGFSMLFLLVLVLFGLEVKREIALPRYRLYLNAGIRELARAAPEDAEYYLKKAAALRENPFSHYWLGVLHARKGLHAEAEREFLLTREIMRRNPAFRGERQLKRAIDEILEREGR
jgi:Zn-dependent protease with chaperone function